MEEPIISLPPLLIEPRAVKILSFISFFTMCACLIQFSHDEWMELCQVGEERNVSFEDTMIFLGILQVGFPNMTFNQRKAKLHEIITQFQERNPDVIRAYLTAKRVPRQYTFTE